VIVEKLKEKSLPFVVKKSEIKEENENKLKKMEPLKKRKGQEEQKYNTPDRKRFKSSKICPSIILNGNQLNEVNNENKNM
jgi:hypothetical protein